MIHPDQDGTIQNNILKKCVFLLIFVRRFGVTKLSDENKSKIAVRDVVTNGIIGERKMR